MTGTDAIFVTASTDYQVDIVDAAVAAAVGFPIDAEALAAFLVDGQTTRVNASALAPEGWDEDEDGAPRATPQGPRSALRWSRVPWRGAAARG